MRRPSCRRLIMPRLKGRFPFSTSDTRPLGPIYASRSRGVSLFHPELDCRNRICRTDGVMLVLVSFDQRHQNVHLVGLRRTLVRLKYSFETTQGSSQIVVAADRLNIHSRSPR